MLEGIDDRAALPRILELAGDADDAVALRALEAAGGRRDPRTVEALAAILTAAGPPPGARARRGPWCVFRPPASWRPSTRWRRASSTSGRRPACASSSWTACSPSSRLLAPRTLRPPLKRLASSSEPEGPPGPDRHGGRTALDDRLVEELASPRLPPRRPRGRSRRSPGVGPPPSRRCRGPSSAWPLRRGADAASLRARAALHEALAALDSRVALYDLRETIEAHPGAVMPALLLAASRVGDASLAPALARAVAEDTALLDGCAGALAAIVARERLRKTSAALQGRPARAPLRFRPALGEGEGRATGLRPALTVVPTAGPGPSSARSGREGRASPRSGPPAGCTTTQLLPVVADGQDQPAPVLELLLEGLGDAGRGGGDDDRVERRRLGPALVAVAGPHLDVRVAEALQACAALARASGATISIVYTCAAISASTAAW